MYLHWYLHCESLLLRLVLIYSSFANCVFLCSDSDHQSVQLLWSRLGLRYDLVHLVLSLGSPNSTLDRSCPGSHTIAHLRLSPACFAILLVSTYIVLKLLLPCLSWHIGLRVKLKLKMVRFWKRLVVWFRRGTQTSVSCVKVVWATLHSTQTSSHLGTFLLKLHPATVLFSYSETDMDGFSHFCQRLPCV